MTDTPKIPPVAARLKDIISDLEKAYAAAKRSAEGLGESQIWVEGYPVAFASKELSALVQDIMTGAEEAPSVFPNLKAISLRSIADLCAQEFGVPTIINTTGRRGGITVSKARGAYCYIARLLFGETKPWTQIGRIISIDHSSVIHAFNSASAAYRSDREFHQDIKAINQGLSMIDNQKKVLNILSNAAENGLPCPSNEEIQEVIGYKQITTASRAVTALNESGLISVSIVDNRRTVTVTSSGKSTLPAKHRFNDAERPVGRKSRAKQPENAKENARQVLLRIEHYLSLNSASAKLLCIAAGLNENFISGLRCGSVPKPENIKKIEQAMRDNPDGTADMKHPSSVIPFKPISVQQKIAPGAKIVSRDPCFKCGVRGDIGCSHQPRFEAIEIGSAVG